MAVMFTNYGAQQQVGHFKTLFHNLPVSSDGDDVKAILNVFGSEPKTGDRQAYVAKHGKPEAGFTPLESVYAASQSIFSQGLPYSETVEELKKSFAEHKLLLARASGVVERDIHVLEPGKRAIIATGYPGFVSKVLGLNAE